AVSTLWEGNAAGVRLRRAGLADNPPLRAPRGCPQRRRPSRSQSGARKGGCWRPTPRRIAELAVGCHVPPSEVTPQRKEVVTHGSAPGLDARRPVRAKRGKGEGKG